jgi:alpha-glucosidase
MFGLWVSEYGFDNWGELDDKLRTLRENRFPVDGFVMDLQWYGNITPIENTQMGALTWDTRNFADPAGKIAVLRDQQGIGLMTIEESYVAKKLPVFSDLNKQGFLVRSCADCDAALIASDWWGTGGMLDWTNPAGADYWHDLKRQPLVDMGILAHWTDLGEPEMYNIDSYYYGFPDLALHSQDDVHNLYNFRWSESIARGYSRNQVDRRPFILSRSGTSGIQRFGTSMWSGDIGTNFPSLSAHLTVQAHMSMSGIDYFGSDIGGFHRGTAGEDLDEIYTKWFAASSLIDVPVRPHTENLCNCKETAPDRVGDMPSNLANLRLRYQLIPYLYSLAHRAHVFGEPTVPPLVYYYQDDPNVRLISDEKMIGRDLLVGTIAQQGVNQRDVYLPAGKWINFRTGEWIDSAGQWLEGISAIQDGAFMLPLFARAGAIIPMMYVDENTLNSLGERSDGELHNELVVRIYPDDRETAFDLYEDDGYSIAYLDGAVMTTLISQQHRDDRIIITIQASLGSYQGAPIRRDHLLQVAIRQGRVATVRVNGLEVPAFEGAPQLDNASQGWTMEGDHLLVIKSGRMNLNEAKRFEVILE